jgi:hypothetical protein
MGAYRNGDCKTLVTSLDVNDHPDICLGGEYSSAFYSFYRIHTSYGLVFESRWC